MRLIRGASGSGKTTLVFREFTEAIQKNVALRKGHSNPRIVVPTATLVRHYRHELARTGLVFHPNTVLSLSRFALDCAPKLSLAPAGLLRALVRDALTRLQLPEFAQVAETAGMADIVLETIARFENAGCTPDRLSATRGLSSHGKACMEENPNRCPVAPESENYRHMLHGSKLHVYRLILQVREQECQVDVLHIRLLRIHLLHIHHVARRSSDVSGHLMLRNPCEPHRFIARPPARGRVRGKLQTGASAQNLC